MWLMVSVNCSSQGPGQVKIKRTVRTDRRKGIQKQKSKEVAAEVKNSISLIKDEPNID